MVSLISHLSQCRSTVVMLCVRAQFELGPEFLAFSPIPLMLGANHEIGLALARIGFLPDHA